MKKILLVLALALAGAGGYGVYRHIYPNVIHAMAICGQVLQNAQPVANQNADLFVWIGGRRHLLEESGSLKDTGLDDRSRGAYRITLDASGNFCLPGYPLKYYYRLGKFQLLSMQLVKVGVAATDPLPPVNQLPSPAATEGFATAGEVLQQEQTLKLTAIFELAAPHRPQTNSPQASGTFVELFNNEERLKTH